MSYTILYKSMFAKVGENQYIPMIEIGDNNVYEGYGRYERRCRDWQSWRAPGFEDKFVLTRQQIFEGIRNLIQATTKRYVNQPAREWDNIPGPYWTYQDVYKQYGWLTAIAIEGKGCSKTTARMVQNFFIRGIEQAVDMRNIKYWGKFPMRLCYYLDCDKKCIYYDNVDEMLADFEKRDATKYWVEYLPGMNTLWDSHRNRRNR